MRTPGLPRRSGGTALFRVAGIEIVADWSLLIIFGLILIGLGAGVFPSWHPGWPAILTWGVAAAAAILFFVSITLHELSHALVGNRLGVRVDRITLFVFGGVAHMEGRPQSPGDELKIAAVGPLVSLVIGLLATFGGAAIAWHQVDLSDPVAAMSRVGPLATVLLWLGPINLLLAAFNLLPGFPLDGGRVLRAALWRITGDLRRATRLASRGGQILAWTLIIAGAGMLFGLWLPVLGGGALQGFWLILIGWFLNNAARMSYQQLVIRQALEGVRVVEIMRRAADIEQVGAASTASDVERAALRSDLDALPVTDGERLVGMIELERLRYLSSRAARPLTAAELMVPAARFPHLAPNEPALHALEDIAGHETIPVIEAEDRLVGVLRVRDLVRWLSFHTDLVPPRRAAP